MRQYMHAKVSPHAFISRLTPLLEAPSLLGLTPIRPPALRLLIPTHARTDDQIYLRWYTEAEALGHLDQVQIMDIEDRAQAVAGIRLQVGPVAVLCALVQVVVLVDQLLELRLHVDDLLSREVELDDGHARLLQVREEADLGRLEEHEGAAFAVGASGCSSHAVDVVSWIIGGVAMES